MGREWKLARSNSLKRWFARKLMSAFGFWWLSEETRTLNLDMRFLYSFELAFTVMLSGDQLVVVRAVTFSRSTWCISSDVNLGNQQDQCLLRTLTNRAATNRKSAHWKLLKIIIKDNVNISIQTYHMVSNLIRTLKSLFAQVTGQAWLCQ